MIMAERQEAADVIYETDEKGQQVVVKSLQSLSRAYLRFTNKTSRPIDVWWRDFHGAKRHYVRLEAGTFYDINSFITHPWEFTDVATKERYVINNKHIFRPPANIGGMMYRTNWNITVGVRSLRQTALLKLAVHINHPQKVDSLGLPKVLSEELKNLVSTIHNPPADPPVRRD